MNKIQQYIYENRSNTLTSFEPTPKERKELERNGYIVLDWTNYYEYITYYNNKWALLKVGIQDEDHVELFELIDSVNE